MSSSRTDGSATLVQVTMPQMGVSVAEGTIVSWWKKPGEAVERDETICEISTDKIDTELPAPESGKLARVLVEEGRTVAVGEVLAEIEVMSDESTSAEGGGAAPASSAPEPAPGGEARRSANGEPDRSKVISPVVQRIAAEHGIDLSQVQGTGVGGRIRKKDVLAFVEQAQASPPQGGRPVHDRPLHSESPYRPEEAQEPEVAARAANGDLREPLSPMRRQIAEHMLRSRRTAAHCTTVIEVDMSRVAARRAELRASFASRSVPLTYLAFVSRATVAALQEHPILNASIEGEEIVRHGDVNLGIAVALDDGLIVPVIRRAQRLSLEGIAAEIADLSQRARTKGLTHEDVQGGTFTITNPGQFGTAMATPIINQPQVAILDLESIAKRPVVVESDAGDSIAIRPTTNLCLSFDHRALDGAEAARFLANVRSRLEGWDADE